MDVDYLLQDPVFVALVLQVLTVNTCVTLLPHAQVMAHAHNGELVSVTVPLLVIDVTANVMMTQHAQDMENVHLLAPVFVTLVTMEMIAL